MNLIEIELFSRDVQFDLGTLKRRPHQLTAHIAPRQARINDKVGLSRGHREVATERIDNGFGECTLHRCF